MYVLLLARVEAEHVSSLQVREEDMYSFWQVLTGHVFSLQVPKERKAMCVLLLAGVEAGHVSSLQVREEDMYSFGMCRSRTCCQLTSKRGKTWFPSGRL
jgi:hypothetical protein